MTSKYSFLYQKCIISRISVNRLHVLHEYGKAEGLGQTPLYQTKKKKKLFCVDKFMIPASASEVEARVTF